jgi:gamma-glutamyltranspeptidase/glutathione hydrolase
LAEILAPAIELARSGLELNPVQAYVLDLLYPIMTLTGTGRKLFEPDGSYVRAGNTFANPELAAFLETLPATGDRAFYEGDLARRISQDMAAGGGLVTEADLGGFRVIERTPVSADYRGFRLLTNPLPSFGGTLIALSLRLLGTVDMDGLRFGSPEHVSLLINVMEEVDRCRAEGYLESQQLPETVLAASITRIRMASGGTTHVSVCDAEGNVASMTTSNGEGSGYLVPGTGIMLNNMMGEDDLHPEGFHASPPGIRVASMMSPSLLLHNDEVRLVLGSGGSKRIRSALLQVVSNVIDFGLNAVEAVQAPRLHWDGACAQIEPGFEQAALRALEERWPVNLWKVPDVYFGGVHAVTPYGEGAADPRRGGCASTLA